MLFFYNILFSVILIFSFHTFSHTFCSESSFISVGGKSHEFVYNKSSSLNLVFCHTHTFPLCLFTFFIPIYVVQNTAVLINLITPFAFQLTFGHEHLIYLVYKVVLIDALFLFINQVADPLSNFNRHFLAPRASSQEKMNEQMKGTPYTLAHKYAVSFTLPKKFIRLYYCFISLFDISSHCFTSFIDSVKSNLHNLALWSNVSKLIFCEHIYFDIKLLSR